VSPPANSLVQARVTRTRPAGRCTIFVTAAGIGAVPSTYVGVLSCCIEWDIDRANAWSRFQAAVADAP
jgi:hypothetical protein